MPFNERTDHALQIIDPLIVPPPNGSHYRYPFFSFSFVSLEKFTMKTESKTKAQLIQELEDLRARVDELEAKEVVTGQIVAALQESEGRFRNIFETSKDGIIFFDGKTRKIILGNNAMAELLGCSKEDLIGLTIPFMHPPEEWVWIEQEFQEHVSSEVYLSTEIPILRNDGSVFFADISSSLITLEGGTYFSTFFHDITERRQTKDLFVASEGRLKAQYQGSPIPTFSWQKKGETFELVDFNRAAQEATWGEAVKYLGKTAAEMYQGRPEVLQDIHRCFTEKKVIKRELLSQHFIPGRTMIATYTFVPPDLIMVHSEDITERKRAEEKLHQAEEKYRDIVENAVEGIFQSTPEGKFLTANTALAIILGYDSPEVFIKSIENSGYQLYADPSDRDRARKILAEQGVLNNFEVQVLRKNGERIWVNLNARLVRDGDGKILYYEGTVENISKRKQTEEALRLAEEKYRAIVENAVEGIFQSTIEGRFLMVNSALAKFHSYDSPEELIADISNIGEQLYVHPEDRQKYRQIIADEGLVKGFETQLYRKDGTIKWGSMNVRSVKDHDGHFLYYEGTIEDITARKEAEEGLQKSLEKLRKALGGIIQAMALTVETRDPYTAGHQRRVADLARAIAQEMGLPEDQVDGLRMAGIVHDLGKISIPAEILSKPSKLSDLEYSLIKVHPQISYDILKDIDFNWPVAQIVLQHHERLDGSGYPNGLSGKAIHLEARILAVADVVEAISSHRPYRPAFGVDVALEEIEKNKAVLYEPGAVEACLRLFKEKGFKFE
jgi:PAS domain S-box-containing protein